MRKRWWRGCGIRRVYALRAGQREQAAQLLLGDVGPAACDRVATVGPDTRSSGGGNRRLVVLWFGRQHPELTHGGKVVVDGPVFGCLAVVEAQKVDHGSGHRPVGGWDA